MGSISTWRVTRTRRCAGARGLWTSMPGKIQSSMRQSTSALPPTSMGLHTPTRSDYDCTVSSVPGLLENQPFVWIPHRQEIYGDLSVGSDSICVCIALKQNVSVGIFNT